MSLQFTIVQGIIVSTGIEPLAKQPQSVKKIISGAKVDILAVP